MKRISEFIKKINPWFIFAIILVAQVIFMFKMCDMKNGYYIDELWSYGLANSYYHPQLYGDGGYDSLKMDPNVFKDYVVVNRGERFRYDSVVYNQIYDSHPPLFYLVLHTVSSFFPEQFSKWFGLIPNLIYFAIMMIFVYKIGRLFSKDKTFPLLLVLFFGFSMGTIDMVTFIRMYLLATMLATIFLYLNMKCIKRNEIRWRDFVAIAVVTFLGCYTHYYFIAFAVPYAICLLIWFIKNKKYKDFWRYLWSLEIGGCSAVLLFPAFLNNVGTQKPAQLGNLFNLTDLKDRLKISFDIIDYVLFGNIFTFVLIIFITLVIIYIITKVLWNVSYQNGKIIFISNKSNSNFSLNRQKVIYVSMILLSTIFYFILVAKVMPVTVDKYFMLIYPTCMFLTFTLIYESFKLWLLKKNMLLVVTIISIIINGFVAFARDPLYMYLGEADKVAISQKYQNDIVIYIHQSKNVYYLNNNLLELMNYKEVWRTTPDVVDLVYEMVDEQDEIILYIDKTMNQTDTSILMYIRQFQDKFNLNYVSFLFEDETVFAYRLYNVEQQAE